MKKLLCIGVAWSLLGGVAAAQTTIQTNQIGEKIERGLNQLGNELSQAWSEAKKSVERMGVQGRVYGRLHWDKSLQGASLEITVRGNDVVVLTGSVPSEDAKQKAGSLANETIGVNRVVNELTIAAVRTARP